MNTNDPNYVKHAKAALASKAEMDKWKTIEIIGLIAFLTSIPIALFLGEWLIPFAVFFIVIIPIIYAGSQKKKAQQDAQDHINRADGMAESLVRATRAKREAEIELDEAIGMLALASSTLSSAKNFGEKNNAEGRVIAAQAAIESAKIRLQRTTKNVELEADRSKSKTAGQNSFISQHTDNSFNGESVLTNDAYKIYLVKKYAIEKNDVLGQFICNDNLFNTVDEALNLANTLEQTSVGGKLISPKISALMSNPTENQGFLLNDDAANYGITFDGMQYCYKEYKYDRVEDAIAYAKKKS